MGESYLVDAFGMRRAIDWEATFRENDAVRILEGEMTGETGTVIAIISREPQPVYLVETCCGRDLMVQESEIELLQGSGFSPDADRLFDDLSLPS